MVEILDNYHGPYTRKLWLLAFAEQANDKTRQGWPPRKLLAARLDVSPPRASSIASECVAEGTITRIRSGHRPGAGEQSGATVYELLPLAARKSSANANPKKSSPSTNSKVEEKGSDQPGKGSGSTPLPAETSPLPLISAPLIKTFRADTSPETPTQPSLDAPAEPATITAPPAACSPAPTAQTLVAEWIDACPKRPPGQVIGQVGKHVAAMLSEGIDPDDLRRGVAAWTDKGLHPSVLPSVVNQVMNSRPARSTTDDRLAQVEALRRARLGPRATTSERVQRAREAGVRAQAMLDSGRWRSTRDERVAQVDELRRRHLGPRTAAEREDTPSAADTLNHIMTTLHDRDIA